MIGSETQESWLALLGLSRQFGNLSHAAGLVSETSTWPYMYAKLVLMKKMLQKLEKVVLQFSF